MIPERLPCNKRDGRARCVGEIGREGRLQAAVGYVRVSLVLRACHDALATGGRLYAIERWKMKVENQLSGPLRSEVSKQCG